MMQRLSARLDRFAASRSREYWIGLAIFFALLSGYALASVKYSQGWVGEVPLYTSLLLLSVSLFAQRQTARLTAFAVAVSLFALWAVLFLSLLWK
jgi:hypothetical protein